MAELFNTVLSSNAIHANKNIIGAGPVGIRGVWTTTKFGSGVLYCSDCHINFTEINLISAKSTPAVAL